MLLTSRRIRNFSTPLRSHLARHPLAALFIAIVCAAGMVYYHLFLLIPKVLEAHASKSLNNGYFFADDFYPVWLTSRESLLHHREPYSPEMTRDIQSGLFGRPLDVLNPFDPPTGYRAFAYPAFVDIIFWPLAYLPFPTVRVLLAVLFPILIAGGILLWMRVIHFRAGPGPVAILVLLTLCSYPILEALFAEQLGLVVGFLLAASMAALAADRYVTAGTLLALTTIKPQVVVLLIFALLLWSLARWRDRRPLVGAFSVTLGVLCCSAFVVWPHWMEHWLHVLFDYRHYSTPRLTSYLLGPRVGPVLGPALTVVLIGVSVVVAWRVRTYPPASSEFCLAICLILAIEVVTLMPGHAVYDHVVLLPGIILVLRFWPCLASSQGTTRWLLVITMAALFWQWAAALVLIASRPLILPERFYSTRVFALPIRMAGPFPFILLALLAVVMRRVVRGSLKLDACDECAEEERE
jgi:hypothetical protein